MGRAERCDTLLQAGNVHASLRRYQSDQVPRVCLIHSQDSKRPEPLALTLRYCKWRGKANGLAETLAQLGDPALFMLVAGMLARKRFRQTLDSSGRGGYLND